MKMAEDPTQILEQIVREGSLANTQDFCFMVPRLELGDFVFKATDLMDEEAPDNYIKIDNLDVPEEILHESELSPRKLREYFEGNWRQKFLELQRIYENVFPLSAIKDKRAGTCIEMAVLSQLYFQMKNRNCLLCSGKSSFGHPVVELHAWNLLKNGNGDYGFWDCGLGVFAPVDNVIVTPKGGLQLVPDLTADGAFSLKGEVVYQIAGEDFYEGPAVLYRD
jgi:hypothetical protein